MNISHFASLPATIPGAIGVVGLLEVKAAALLAAAIVVFRLRRLHA